MRMLNTAVACLLLLAGCRSLGGKEDASSDLENTFRDSEQQVKEIQTLSSLVAMESALDGFIKQDKQQFIAL